MGVLGIDDHWAGKIAEALKVNSSLQSIDLENNKIEAEGPGKIAEALKVNSSLQSISLDDNKIGANVSGIGFYIRLPWFRFSAARKIADALKEFFSTEH